jgi:hypothetical protein
MIFVSGANGQLAKAVITTILSAGRGRSLAVGTRDVNSHLPVSSPVKAWTCGTQTTAIRS